MNDRRNGYSLANGYFGCDSYAGLSKWVNPTRTKEKWDHPYSYDEFFHFGSREAIKGRAGVYSDRLWGWDPEKFDRLWKKHVHRRWESASPQALSAFLSEYHGKKLRAVALAEGCNISNGYPYFVVWYEEASR